MQASGGAEIAGTEADGRDNGTGDGTGVSTDRGTTSAG